MTESGKPPGAAATGADANPRQAALLTQTQNHGWRVHPARWGKLERAIGVALYLGINAPLILILLQFGPLDWEVLSDAPAAYVRGDLYAPAATPYAWSPVAALLMAPIVPLGYLGWTIIHVGCLALLRSRALILLAAGSVGFWADVTFGNTVTFVFVTGVLALRGSKLGTVAYITLCLLMPRPLQLPLLAWLLWSQPQWRLPALALFTAHAAIVLATGYADDWVAMMTAIGGQQVPGWANWGPSQLLGVQWLIVGVPLAVFLTWHGFVGLAGIAMSPYVFPQYFLMALADFERRPKGHRERWRSTPPSA